MIVCTAGHIDHGKTALVRALTGIDADRLAEEKARGITIDLGFAYQTLADGTALGFVDVPGHERFVHNMLAGVSGIDLAMLVVAADDGVMPQTVEHLNILDLLGVRRGLVALTKIDTVDATRRDAVTAQIRHRLAGTALAEAPIFPVSSLSGEGVAQLAAHLGVEARRPRPAAHGRFRLAIDRAFTIAGAGVVVTGTAFAGRVSVGERLWLSPSGREVRVRALHAQNQKSERGEAGQRLALNLAAPQLSKDDIARGEWALDPALHHPVDRFDARFRLLVGEARPLVHWTAVHLHLASAHATGRIALLEGDSLAPGGEGLAQLVLDRKIGALAGDRFILRDVSAQRTIGGGRVIDLFPPLRGRRTEARLHVLRLHANAEPATVLRRRLAEPPGWIDLDRFQLQWNQTDDPAEGVTIIGKSGARFAFAPAAWDALRQRLIATLAAHHAEHPDQPGLQAPRLRSALDPKMPPTLFEALLAAAVTAGEAVADGPWYRRPDHEARLSPEDERLWAEIEPLLLAEPFRPPRVRDLAQELDVPEGEVRGLLKRQARLGRVVLVALDHYFPRAVVAEMAAIVHRCAAETPDGWLSAAQFRDRLDNGRKVAIQILEFFDKVGVTLRKGDRRKPREDRRHLFGAVEGREPSPVGRPDFKSGNGRSPAVGGFDSHSLPPKSPARR